MINEDEIKNAIVYGKNLLKFLKRDKGYYLDFDGIIRPKHDQPQMVEKFPWIFLNGAGRLKCPLWQSLHFGCFNLIPNYCQKKCWKITIIPKYLKDLFKLNDFFEKHNFESKLGLDMRPYTFGIYRGFVYFQDNIEAKNYEIVLKDIFEDGLFEIFLKRGCTEFENKIPSSDWKGLPSQADFEQILELSVDHTDGKSYSPNPAIKEINFTQPDWVKHLIKLYWTQTAYASGDNTWVYSPYKKFIQISKDSVRY